MSPEKTSGHHLTTFFLTLTLLLSSLTTTLSQPTQLDHVLNFKSKITNTKYTSSNPLTTWTDQTPVCNFTGISCNSENLITEISLSDQKLTGIPDFGALCKLEKLEKIDLGSNYFHGLINIQILDCANLKYLDLGLNNFSGEVPEVWQLSQLTFLNLNLSGFTGKFPWKGFENLKNLSFLSVGDNVFDEMMFPLEILELHNLEHIYMSNCSVGGKIPEMIGNLSSLRSIELSDNRLVGEIPAGISKLLKLEMLEVYNNGLSGVIPAGFGNLVNLVQFDVSNNSLEGDVFELRNLTNLESLQLFENGFSGRIPEEFGEFKYLTQFSIYDNQFTGELPAKIGSWAEFEYIDVTQNMLTGAIPPDMCKMGKLGRILMIENNFTGGLPETYASCDSLFRLRVNNNSLSGRVPQGIWSLPLLIMIDLSMNQFEGQIGSNIGEAKSLAQLILGDNQFSGELPVEISKVSTLVEIELISNQFTGTIPSNIGDLKKLTNLHLKDNMFSGPIPESLGSCVCLYEVDLAGNSLTGHIPASLGLLPSLNSLNLSGNKLSGLIPTSLSSLKLTLIDLSNNMLVGRVPESLLFVAYNGSFAGNPGLCADDSKDLRKCSPISHKSHRLNVSVYCFIAGALLVVLSLSCYVFVKLRKNTRDSPINRVYSWDVKQYHVLKIHEDEVLRCLKDENIIGKGGSGNVYKVVLQCGEQLAVKHMWKTEPDNGSSRSSQSSSPILPKGKTRWREYDAEVAALSSLRHMNVVKLYCSITSEDSNLLVYEYMPNGSLWDRLHTYQKIEMDWRVRYEIAIGAARGLEYLHHACDRPVIHRDVKSSNILLDEEMKPKIADFGLAKFVQTEKVMESTHLIAGTHGYIAPEYGYTRNVTEKSDIYSFGVVLMELVTGKKPTEPEFGENKDIVHWVHNEMRKKDNISALVDPSISKDAKEDTFKVLSIAARCTMKIPTLRPSMRMVVKMLEEIEPISLTDIVIDKPGENNISLYKV